MTLAVLTISLFHACSVVAFLSAYLFSATVVTIASSFFFKKKVNGLHLFCLAPAVVGLYLSGYETRALLDAERVKDEEGALDSTMLSYHAGHYFSVFFSLFRSVIFPFTSFFV